MMDQLPIRASDQDRECAVEVLRSAFAAGCLDRGELEQRGGAAYGARTLGELQNLTADLPGWLFDHSVPLPPEYPCRRSRQRVGAACPRGFIVALAVFWLIAVSMAWAPLAALPLALVWLVVMVRQGWEPGLSRRPRRSSDPGRPGSRS